MVCQVRAAPQVLAHTACWLDCRQLAADAAQAESPQRSSAAEARAQLADKASMPQPVPLQTLLQTISLALCTRDGTLDFQAPDS